MRRSSSVGLATLVAISCLLPAGAAADPPLTDRFPVDAEFGYQPLSDECGFPVTAAFNGTFAIKVFTRHDGSVREIDSQPSTKVTFRSATGEVSLPFSASLHTAYPDGIFVGAPATATLTGRTFGMPPFAGAGKGRLVLSGLVEEVEDGFAFTRFTELVSSSGDFTGDDARICDALAG
jgi:hypothetical protein